MPKWLFDAAGLGGVVVYLGSYAALQAGLIRGTGYAYASFNILAASLVLISLAQSFNLSSAIIQASWIAISLVGMTRFYLINRKVRFSPEELELLGDSLPLSPRADARSFFDAGHWEELPSGTVLMTEGETHGILVYLARGHAEVRANGKIVGTCVPGRYLGEMTVLYDTPATATVELTEPSRIFRITAEKLKRIIGRRPEMRAIIEGSLTRDTVRKLVAANERLASVT